MEDVVRAGLLQLGKLYSEHPVRTLVAIFLVLTLTIPSGLGVCRSMYVQEQDKKEQEKKEQKKIQQGIQSSGDNNQNIDNNYGTATQNNFK